VMRFLLLGGGSRKSGRALAIQFRRKNFGGLEAPTHRHGYVGGEKNRTRTSLLATQRKTTPGQSSMTTVGSFKRERKLGKSRPRNPDGTRIWGSTFKLSKSARRQCKIIKGFGLGRLKEARSRRRIEPMGRDFPWKGPSIIEVLGRKEEMSDGSQKGRRDPGTMKARKRRSEIALGGTSEGLLRGGAKKHQCTPIHKRRQAELTGRKRQHKSQAILSDRLQEKPAKMQKVHVDTAEPRVVTLGDWSQCGLRGTSERTLSKRRGNQVKEREKKPPHCLGPTVPGSKGPGTTGG